MSLNYASEGQGSEPGLGWLVGFLTSSSTSRLLAYQRLEFSKFSESSFGVWQSSKTTQFNLIIKKAVTLLS